MYIRSKIGSKFAGDDLLTLVQKRAKMWRASFYLRKLGPFSALSIRDDAR